MKSRAVSRISTLLIFITCVAGFARPDLALGSVAQAAPVYTFEEVPEAEAESIAPLSQKQWNDYAVAGASKDVSFDVGTIIIGTIAIDALVNIGKSIWALIEAGRPKIDLTSNIASAVPQGIKSWTELDSWKDPIAKLYKTQLYSAQSRKLGDVYYRLLFTYGGRYKGVGSYLTNVTILPAQISVPYHRNFYAETKVTELVNHGTRSNPVAGMTLLLTWGLDSLTARTMQSISLHVRGDGKILVLPNADDVPQTIEAPVRTAPAKPVAAPAPMKLAVAPLKSTAAPAPVKGAAVPAPKVVAVDTSILSQEPSPLDLAAD